ncbi:MAG TPA: carbohydrate ABC transporter permease [Caldilineaceae bacterium]|nr:carbohydrate ABC transporter permease [Caldilineaceae bacterium]
MATTVQVGSEIGVTRKEGRSFLYYIGELLLWILLIGIALYEIAPISWMVSTSLRDPKNSFDLPPDFLPTAFHWQNYVAVINSPDIEFLRFFWNSLKIALIVTGAQLLTCSMAGFAFGRLRFKGRDFLFGLFLASLMVPGTVTLIPSFILIRELNLMDTHWALILPGITSAFGVFLLRQHFMSLPQELIDAAKIDGAGYFRVYWQILLPLTGPALSALGIFTFLGAWNNFVGPLLFLRSWENYTFPIAIATLRGYMGSGNQSEVLAGIMISIFPILLVFLFAQRWIVQGAAITGMKG